MKRAILHTGTPTIFAGMLALGILGTVSAADTPAPIDYAKDLTARTGQKYTQGKVGESLL